MLDLSKVLTFILQFCLCLLIVLFFFFRFSELDIVPGGFFTDESSIALNALSILRNGTDEHEMSFPLYFKAFGDYKNPVYIYSQSIVFWLFGASRLTARLTSALWGLASILAFVVFLKVSRQRRPVALVSLLVLLSSPWSFQLSRTVFEIAALPFFLIVCAVFVVLLENEFTSVNKKINLCHLVKDYLARGDNHQFKTLVWWWLLGFALFAGISFYTYTAARLLAPIMLFSLMLIFRKKCKSIHILFLIVIFFLLFLPVIFWEIANPGVMLARYKVVGLQYYTSSFSEFVLQFLANYISHFSPEFLFNHGDGNLRHSTNWHSVFLWSTIPFLLAGIYSTIKTPTLFKTWLVMVIVLAPIPAALSVNAPHTLRSIGFLVYLVLLMSVGVGVLYKQINNVVIFYTITLVTLGIESILFLNHYHSQYKFTNDSWFETGRYQIIQKSFDFTGPHFFSEQLFNGYYATIAFENATRMSGVVQIYGEKKHYATPETAYQAGVYAFIENECDSVEKLDSSEFERDKLWENNTGCIFHFYPAVTEK